MGGEGVDFRKAYLEGEVEVVNNYIFYRDLTNMYLNFSCIQLSSKNLQEHRLHIKI